MFFYPSLNKLNTYFLDVSLFVFDSYGSLYLLV